MKKTILVLLSALLVVSLAGCASNTTPTPSPSPITTTAAPTQEATVEPTTMPTEAPTIAPDTTLPMTDMPEAGTSAEPTAPAASGTMSDEDAMTVAKKVSDEVQRLSEIKKATTLVVGDTALIGVEFDAQYKGEMTTRIKDMVANRAKAADKRIQNVSVTADPDLLTRVQDLGKKLDGGSVISDITTEFTEIVNRIAPVG
ncbi:YhcN/YlaJ family sporulation lipoprotein [Beduinella massiliensis]|uniref:YhcN/YlaJ family sporulation lipoprotein n=1 Tax=Beduinella massiliensis TaxID=1852363 RepID=UPI000C83EF87